MPFLVSYFPLDGKALFADTVRTMQKNYFSVAVLAIVFLGAGTQTASAHESRSYTISGVPYSFTVGSLEEPIVVDDKTGLDLTISRYGEPFIGAEAQLKVEIASGSNTKVFDLATVYGTTGKYKTTFFITSGDPLAYRIFGTLEGRAIDFLFNCSAAGHAMHAVEDTTTVQVSEGIIRTLARGAFGCPAPKAAYEFPHATADQAALVAGMTSGRWMGGIALLLAIASLAVSMRRNIGIAASPAPHGFLRARVVRYGAVVLVAVLAVLGIAFSTDTFSSERSAGEVSPAVHAHAMKEVDASKPVPSLALEAIKDAKDGYNLRIRTTNFRFTPESSGRAAVDGTGHAHVYVNSIKIGRAYGEWYHISATTLVSGKNTIEVTLNADDHSEWTVGGEHLSAKATVTK